MAIYRLKRYYSVVGHSSNSVELRWGVWNPVSLMLSDESESGNLYKLVSGLDGSMSVADLARQTGVARSDVEALIDHLISLGAIEDKPGSAFDYYVDTCLPTANLRQKEQDIVLLGDANLTSKVRQHLETGTTPFRFADTELDEEARRLLKSTDTSWQNDGVQFYEALSLFKSWNNAFIVSLSRSTNPLFARTLNRVACELGVAVIHATLDGPFLMVGPTVIPNQSACYECFETRIAMNMRENANYVRYKNALAAGNVKPADIPFLDALDGLLASHVALEVTNYLAASTNFTTNKVLTIHLPTMEYAFQDILRLPSCSVCGSVAEKDDKELYIDLQNLVSA